MSSIKTKDETIANLKHSASDMRDDLNQAAHDAGRKVRSMFNTANHDISDVSEKVTSEIRSNPVRSSAIALGVGVVVGLLFSATRRS